jgi:hypothetical protein
LGKAGLRLSRWELHQLVLFLDLLPDCGFTDFLDGLLGIGITTRLPTTLTQFNDILYNGNLLSESSK